MAMTGSIDRVEVITSVQRRRRWSAEEKARIVLETYAPGMLVLLVRAGSTGSREPVFTWPRLYAEGALSVIGAGEEVVPASEYRALQHQVREPQRLLGKKTLENQILREALDLTHPKKSLLRSPLPGTARREGDIRYVQRSALQSGRASGPGNGEVVAHKARGRACHQGTTRSRGEQGEAVGRPRKGLGGTQTGHSFQSSSISD